MRVFASYPPPFFFFYFLRISAAALYNIQATEHAGGGVSQAELLLYTATA